MCSIIGTPKTINFPFGTNGKLMVLGVPILKHFRGILTSTKFFSLYEKLKIFFWYAVNIKKGKSQSFSTG